MVGRPNGGSLDRVHVEAGVPVLSHFLHDFVPYWDCCLLSKNCGKFFEKRPSDDGSRYVPVRPGEIPVLINDHKVADDDDGLNLMLESYRYFKLKATYSIKNVLHTVVNRISVCLRNVLIIFCQHLFELNNEKARTFWKVEL